MNTSETNSFLIGTLVGIALLGTGLYVNTAINGQDERVAKVEQHEKVDGAHILAIFEVLEKMQKQINDLKPRQLIVKPVVHEVPKHRHLKQKKSCR